MNIAAHYDDFCQQKVNGKCALQADHLMNVYVDKLTSKMQSWCTNIIMYVVNHVCRLRYACMTTKHAIARCCVARVLSMTS